MARPRVRLDRIGVKALLNDAGVRSELAHRMYPVEAAAKASAPIESGAYRASIHIEHHTTDRAVVRVVADVAYALAVEARTGNLARALDAAGGA